METAGITCIISLVIVIVICLTIGELKDSKKKRMKSEFVSEVSITYVYEGDTTKHVYPVRIVHICPVSTESVSVNFGFPAGYMNKLVVYVSVTCHPTEENEIYERSYFEVPDRKFKVVSVENKIGGRKEVE